MQYIRVIPKQRCYWGETLGMRTTLHTRGESVVRNWWGTGRGWELPVSIGVRGDGRAERRKRSGAGRTFQPRAAPL
jgi:hypothetical protein